MLLAFLILCSFHFNPFGLPPERIMRLYQKADQLFHLPNATPVSDSIALAGFQQIIDAYGPLAAVDSKDTLLFQCYLKKGILLDSRYDFPAAKAAYCQALHLHQQADSLGFVLDIYTGASYYNINDFDSANFFLLKAASLVGHFRDPEDEVRLYNTLGVLYSDNGNYQQGRNYFNRALAIVKSRQPFDKASAVSLQTNIATCYSRLGSYQEALSIYQTILGYHIFTDPIYLNMGMAYASLGRNEEAMSCFRKVNAGEVPAVLNEMGAAELQLQRQDSAALFLDRLQALQAGSKQSLNELDLGTNHLYRADLLALSAHYLEALDYLQKAIVSFSSNFSDKDIYSNPSSFIGTFATYRLYDALYKKAVLFEDLYRQEPKEIYLKAAYDAYQSALSLLRYIERSYDTDDAKIFLKKNNKAIYQGALSTCLALYRLHPGSDYLGQAFMISEKNKASIIISNLQEKNLTGADGGLLQRERNIRYNIARLDVKSETAATDHAAAEKIAGEKAAYEIELSRLQKQLEQNGSYYRLKYDDASQEVGQLQGRLGRNEALISFYASATTLQIFALTSSTLSYVAIDSLSGLQKEVSDWLDLLKVTENGRKFKGEALGERLYQRLIKPIQAMVPGKDEWIIVPDGFLCYLPFESLPANAEGTSLLETTTVSYQLSSRLVGLVGLVGMTDDGEQSRPPATVLAFAPFAESGSAGFRRLPASQEETAGLPGIRYEDSMATKARFLKEINQCPILHLATHAISSPNDAAASYIAFYPQHDTAPDDRLFLEELYGLDMSRTRLVIISACETGEGELVSNEGVISLARAFSYAGCATTISSLWKADDQATSFILRRFYVYLRKGYTQSGALRSAKLDYLHSDAIHKSPGYWSHLILTGSTLPLYKKGYPYWWGILVLAFLGVLLLILILKKVRSGRSVSQAKDLL